jgi:hypothetical protein
MKVPELMTEARQVTEREGPIDPSAEAAALIDCMERGDSRASVHLARLMSVDTRGTLQPFADVLAARLADHLSRYAELGITSSWTALEDEVYGLMQAASIDWGRIAAVNPERED